MCYSIPCMPSPLYLRDLDEQHGRFILNLHAVFR